MSAHKNLLSDLNAKLANPLADYSHAQLQDMGARYAQEHGLGQFADDFRKGAMLAQDPLAFETLPLLSEVERIILRREVIYRWRHPKRLSVAMPPLLLPLSTLTRWTVQVLHGLHMLVSCCGAGHGRERTASSLPSICVFA